jgi:hypothetical protein
MHQEITKKRKIWKLFSASKEKKEKELLAMASKDQFIYKYVKKNSEADNST